MTLNSRRKGNDGELEVAAIFRSAGFDADRVPNSGALKIKGDLYGDLPAHVEVKRGERCRLPEWWVQTRADAPAEALPLLCWRQNRGEWLAVLPLEALVPLLAGAALAGVQAVAPTKPKEEPCATADTVRTASASNDPAGVQAAAEEQA